MSIDLIQRHGFHKTTRAIQTTARVKSATILEESWRLVETCCHSDFSEKQADKSGRKKTRQVLKNNNKRWSFVDRDELVNHKTNKSITKSIKMWAKLTRKGELPGSMQASEWYTYNPYYVLE